GPGAALGFGVADALAGLAGGARGHREVAVVAAGPINGKFAEAVARLDDARAADAGSAGGVLHPGRHLGLQPALRRLVAGRIAEAPGPAMAVAVAPRGALGRIAGAHRKARIVAAATVEADLCAGCRRQAQGRGNSQYQRSRNTNHQDPGFAPSG